MIRRLLTRTVVASNSPWARAATAMQRRGCTAGQAKEVPEEEKKESRLLSNGYTLVTDFVESEVMGHKVPYTVALPPNHEKLEEPALVVLMHGAGGNRDTLNLAYEPDANGKYPMGFGPELLPQVEGGSMEVMCSAGPTSMYKGKWPEFFSTELPEVMNKRYRSTLEPKRTALMGGSMGGHGSLRTAFSYPERFKAVCAVEPAVMPSLKWPGGPVTRKNFCFQASGVEGDIMNSSSAVGDGAQDLYKTAEEWEAEQSTTVAIKNRDRIVASGLEIRLECGDSDGFYLHDGTEFLHRCLWDLDIKHEYHLVRWADHAGLSLARRMKWAMEFVANCLNGGLAEPTDLPATEAELKCMKWLEGGMKEAPPAEFTEVVMDMERAPSWLARMVAKKVQAATANDPEQMKRGLMSLPPTGLK